MSSAFPIRHIAARLAQDHDASGEVPGAQALLPEAVESPRCGPGKVERRGPRAPDAGGNAHDGAEFPQKECVTWAAAMRDAGRQHAVGKLGPRCHPETPVVEKG